MTKFIGRWLVLRTISSRSRFPAASDYPVWCLHTNLWNGRQFPGGFGRARKKGFLFIVDFGSEKSWESHTYREKGTFVWHLRVWVELNVWVISANRKFKEVDLGFLGNINHNFGCNWVTKANFIINNDQNILICHSHFRKVHLVTMDFKLIIIFCNSA